MSQASVEVRHMSAVATEQRGASEKAYNRGFVVVVLKVLFGGWTSV